MRERKVWTEEQDKILRLLRQARGVQKWSHIARIMEAEFGLQGRTGKQCRQRYHNHLDSSIVSAEWTAQQQQTLFKMHEQVGNKWSVIALKLPGRSQNCVKNHFYSKLRKALRRLNKLLQQNGSGHRMVRQSLLSKIVKATESKFNFNSKVDEELAQFCNCIKNRLLRLEGEREEVEVEFAKRIVADIQIFEKNHRKGYKCVKEEMEYQYKTYLKPPTPTLKKNASTRSISSEKSEDSCYSFLSSSGYSSSDWSSFDQDLQSNKSSNTPAQKSLGRTSGRNSQQIPQTQHLHFPQPDHHSQSKPTHNENILKPSDFQIEYEGLIMEDSRIYSIDHQMRQINFDETPQIGSILAPIDHYAPFYLFENEDEGIEFKDCDRMDLQ